ncbi:MAG: DUF488 domain-containing protein [Acidobacteriota bacterium]|nr:DUF488 domain-containing protein [Acidobacteriota bacterium]
MPTDGNAVDPIFTVGHSTRALEDFIAILDAHRVKLLIDVRTMPRSRHNPQFNRETLPGHLQASSVDYLHLPQLGGLRKAQPDSLNTAWRNLSFRGFADYMQTPEFEAGLLRVIGEAKSRSLALMCAEAVPWRCHRSLIADSLKARGLSVFEIASATRAQPHKMTPFARVDGRRVTYPPAAELSQP